MFLVLSTLILVIVWALYHYRRLYKRYESVHFMFPGMPTIPILGNVHQMWGDTHDIHNIGLKYGIFYRRSFRVWVGPFVFVVLQKPSDIEAVLNNSTDIKKATLYDFIIPWVKRGLLTSYGDKWKRQRKLLTPAFHFKILDGFLDIFHRNCLTMCNILETKVDSDGVDVFDLVRLCALDNIAETSMGVTIKALENPNSEYIEAVKGMCQIITIRTVRPWLRFNTLFNLTSWGSLQRKCLKILHGYSMNIIDQKIEERKNGPKCENSTAGENDGELGIRNKKVFLDLLLDYYENGMLTKDEVQEEVDTFMFEGHDTITSAISFALYFLANHPNVQEKVYDEQTEIFGGSDQLASVDNLTQMKYLEMVIKESLRLCPSVPAFGRQLERDVKLDDYATIPSGVEALVLTPCLHRHPDVWERPEEFDPDRFLPDNVAKRHLYSFLPFSAGPRNCIGMRFAMMEMKATLSNVVRRFKLKPCAGEHKLELAMETILSSRNGAPIAVELRKA